jgi:hypothetical protein
LLHSIADQAVTQGANAAGAAGALIHSDHESTRCLHRTGEDMVRDSSALRRPITAR